MQSLRSEGRRVGGGGGCEAVEMSSAAKPVFKESSDTDPLFGNEHGYGSGF